MTIGQVAEWLGARILTCEGQQDTVLTGSYCSDLLSDVMAKAGAGSLWITLVTHQNSIAVASLLGLPAIVVVGGALPEQVTLQKAEEEQISILTTPYSAYEACGRLYQAGLAVGVKGA